MSGVHAVVSQLPPASCGLSPVSTDDVTPLQAAVLGWVWHDYQDDRKTPVFTRKYKDLTVIVYHSGAAWTAVKTVNNAVQSWFKPHPSLRQALAFEY